MQATKVSSAEKTHQPITPLPLQNPKLSALSSKQKGNL